MPKAYSYIRMSTERQLKGDSLRRQAEASRLYAQSQGLELDEEFSLKDLGVSAFRGANLREGALGKFLDAVKKGAIERGSYLLVESFDRLSRENLDNALSLFLDITKNGINLVTLADGKLYEAGKTEFSALIYSIVVMSRAHEESLMKSQRLSAAWSAKRGRIRAQKLTAQAPKWLRLSADKSTFEIDEKRAQIVRQVFDHCIKGMGNYAIVTKLNRDGVPPFGRGRGWQTSSINKLLTTRAVLGEFQPKRMQDGIAVPEGDPISDYFPSIVDEGVFLRAQAARALRRVGGSGRKGRQFANLFSGIARCGYCGSSMHYVNKGSGPKGGTYLVCNSARRRSGCGASAWRYDAIEIAILSHIQIAELQPATDDSDLVKARVAASNLLTEVTERRRIAESQRETTFELLARNRTEFLMQKFEAIERDIADLDEKIRSAKLSADEAAAEISQFYESKDAIKSLIALLQDGPAETRFELRSNVAARLRGLVAELSVYSDGSKPLGADAKRFPMSETWPDRRFFLIESRDGDRMFVVPNSENPYLADGRFQYFGQPGQPKEWKLKTGDRASVDGEYVVVSSEMFELSEDEFDRFKQHYSGDQL